MQVTDQMGRSLEVNFPVKRIVSLVPSQTEFLYHLGLDEEVVGVTKFCIHPEHWWRGKKRVGGTKNAKVDIVRELQPDLIIGNKEENDKSNVEELMQFAPVWMSDIKTLDDAYEMMLLLGKLLGKEERAKNLVQEIKSGFSEIKKWTKKNKVLYFIWKNPWMMAGQNTFISNMLESCGFENQAKENRYPEFFEDKVSPCDLIFLSSEPYPFKEKDILDLKQLYPEAKIMLVDGEMFSWYGSRLLLAPEYFKKLIISVE